jgi:hypothetical protein
MPKMQDIEPFPQGEAVMTFGEIGAKLGITRGGAWMLYQSAVRKLRRRCNSAALRELQELVNLKVRKQS